MKAVVFDFDGLIVDTETVWYESFKEVLSNHGLELSVEQFARVIGTDDADLYAYIEKNLSSPVQSVVIKDAAHKLFAVKMGEPVLRNGVKEYLIEAKELGLKIGLASSSSREWVEGYLKKLNIFSYFDVIRTRDDVSKVKPDPELYVKAVEALGVDATEAFAFEDSLNGLKSARAAGIQCVVVPNSVTAHLNFTDYSLKISSMSDLRLKQVLSLIKQVEGDELERVSN
ncbi:MAG: HAD family hydrolase [Bacillus sp. (in: firmicutes)]